MAKPDRSKLDSHQPLMYAWWMNISTTTRMSINFVNASVCTVLHLRINWFIWYQAFLRIIIYYYNFNSYGLIDQWLTDHKTPRPKITYALSSEIKLANNNKLLFIIQIRSHSILKSCSSHVWSPSILGISKIVVPKTQTKKRVNNINFCMDSSTILKIYLVEFHWTCWI